MVEIILMLFTGLAFLVLLAAVPMELDEERRDERAREASRPTPLAPQPAQSVTALWRRFLAVRPTWRKPRRLSCHKGRRC